MRTQSIWFLPLFTLILCEPAEADPMHALRSGAWALDFKAPVREFVFFPPRGEELEQILLTSPSMEISAKRHFSERTAVGLAIKISVASSEDNWEIVGIDYQEFRKADDDINAIQIATDYIFYPYPRPRVNIVLVFGPVGGWGKLRQARTSDFVAPLGMSFHRSVDSSEGFRVGGRGLVGLEWFFAKQLSLATRHGVEIAYSSWDETHRSWNKSTGFVTSPFKSRSSDSSTDVRMTLVELGFSVYF